MHIPTETTETNGIKTVKDICPQGWTVIDSYHPSTSICPWDAYGRRHQSRYRKVLKQSGIDSMPLLTRQTNLSPFGSGSGGAIRFGDSMMPGSYEIAVPDNCVDAAKQAIKNATEKT